MNVCRDLFSARTCAMRYDGAICACGKELSLPVAQLEHMARLNAEQRSHATAGMLETLQESSIWL